MTFSKKAFRILGAVGLIAAGAAVYVVLHLGEVSTDDAAIDATVVTISPKVSGYVKTLNVTDNQAVKARDVLLEIDPRDYRIALERAVAALAAAKAAVESAQAEWDSAQANLKRQQSLTDAARSRQQLEDAVAAEKRARAQTGQLTALAAQAEAELAQAQKNLDDTRITAPMAGRVSNRTVERGDYLVPGQQLIALVGNDIWVTANFKETQLKHMRAGQRVDIGVDAYPDLDLHGKIDSIQSGAGAAFSAFPAQNATGNFVKIVQRVPVKITIDGAVDTRYVLGPGMSVEPTVHTQ